MKRSLLLVCAFWLMSPAAVFAEEVPFALSWIPTGRDIGFFAARAKGFYEAEGLKVDILKGTGSGDTIRRIAANIEPYGFADTASLVIARSKGAAVKVIAMYHDRSLFAVYALEGSGIQNPRDLAGKRIGSPPKSATRTVFPALAHRNGLALDRVQFIDMTTAAQVPSLLAGQVDAILLFANEGPLVRSSAAKQGRKATEILFGDFGVDVYSNGIIATDSTLKAKPDLTRRFVRGSLKGWAWAIAEPEAAADLFAREHPAISREMALAYWKVAVAHMVTPTSERMGLGYMTQEKMTVTRDVMTEFEKLPVRVPVEDLYTNDFLTKVVPPRR